MKKSAKAARPIVEKLKKIKKYHQMSSLLFRTKSFQCKISELYEKGFFNELLEIHLHFSDVPGTIILPEKSDQNLSEPISDFNENSTNNNNSPTQENNIFYPMPEPPPYKRRDFILKY